MFRSAIGVTHSLRFFGIFHLHAYEVIGNTSSLASFAAVDCEVDKGDWNPPGVIVTKQCSRPETCVQDADFL